MAAMTAVVMAVELGEMLVVSMACCFSCLEG